MGSRSRVCDVVWCGVTLPSRAAFASNFSGVGAKWVKTSRGTDKKAQPPTNGGDSKGHAPFLSSKENGGCWPFCPIPRARAHNPFFNFHCREKPLLLKPINGQPEKKRGEGMEEGGNARARARAARAATNPLGGAMLLALVTKAGALAFLGVVVVLERRARGAQQFFESKKRGLLLCQVRVAVHERTGGKNASSSTNYAAQQHTPRESRSKSAGPGIEPPGRLSRAALRRPHARHSPPRECSFFCCCCCLSFCLCVLVYCATACLC